jgi:hypothetical protein
VADAFRQDSGRITPALIHQTGDTNSEAERTIWPVKVELGVRPLRVH